MSAPRIKRDIRAIVRREEETKRLIRTSMATVSIAVDIETGKILCVGASHEAVANHIDAPEGSWQIIQERLWR
jgi:hypothetical protein